MMQAFQLDINNEHELSITITQSSDTDIDLSALASEYRVQKIVIKIAPHISIKVSDSRNYKDFCAVDFHLEDHAQLFYLFDLKASQENDTFTAKFYLNAYSSMHGIMLNTGAVKTEINAELHLLGAGSKAILHGLYALSQSQSIHINTFQYHYAVHTSSELIMRGILRDASYADYKGTIFVHKEGKHTNAIQENKNLLLSSQARAHSVPSLEVLTNEVQCKHGAAIGRLDELLLFYLQSRGLSNDQAKKLLIRAFFAPILASLQENHRELLYERI